MDNNIEILNANKELIKTEQHNGFKIANNKVLMFIKKIPSNIYKLTLLFLATIADAFPEFVSKVPLIGYGVAFIKSYAENFVAQVASDECFDKLICPLVGLQVDKNNFDYLNGFWEFTHHEGKYFQLSLTIKSIATFVMEHPALVLAGGGALLALVYKLVKALITKGIRAIKYHNMSDKQKEVYELLNDILENSRKIKKTKTGDVLVKDLKITYDIIGQLKDYPEMLDRLSNILFRLDEAIEKNNQDEYENCRNELEANVFIFDNVNSDYLRRKIHLTEETKPIK